MMPSRLTAVSLATLVALIALASTVVRSSAADQTAPRQIPGITARDQFPNGCVDCHIVVKDGDMRLSTLMAAYAKTVPAPLLDKTRAATADPKRVKGVHPAVPNVKANIPQSCLAACHKAGSTIAAPFATLMHAVHLTGIPNRFVTQFQGECTHCHKMNPKTGAWRIPSAPEK
jgi:hypothetical protein